MRLSPDAALSTAGRILQGFTRTYRILASFTPYRSSGGLTLTLAPLLRTLSDVNLQTKDGKASNFSVTHG